MALTTLRSSPRRERDTSPQAVPVTRGSLPPWGPSAALAVVAIVVGALIALTDVNAALLVIGAAVLYCVGTYLWSRVAEGRRHALDRLITIIVASAFLTALAPLISVIVTVLVRGLNRFDVTFFTNSMSGVLGAGGGAYHALMGTLIITGLAAAMSIPIGILAAIYLVEYGTGRLARAITFFVDVMTGIPSILAGLFAYALFVLIFGPGVRLGIMGAIALTVLMIPVVVRSTEEMLKIVPNELREASLALGVPKWRTIVKVVLPTAVAGIATGITLAIARVIGETAPLLVTVGLTTSVNLNPFDGRMATLPVFSYYSYATPGIPREAFTDRAWAAALILMTIVLVLNLVARLIARVFAPKTR